MTYSSLPASETPNFLSSASHISLPLLNDRYESTILSPRMLIKAALKVVSSFLERLFLSGIKFPLRCAIDGVIAAHGLKPEHCSRTPSFVIDTFEHRWLHRSNKATWGKLPEIRFLDC